MLLSARLELNLESNHATTCLFNAIGVKNSIISVFVRFEENINDHK